MSKIRTWLSEHEAFYRAARTCIQAAVGVAAGVAYRVASGGDFKWEAVIILLVSTILAALMNLKKTEIKENETLSTVLEAMGLNLEDITAKGLLQIAQNLGLDISGGTKNEIIKAIENAQILNKEIVSK